MSFQKDLGQSFGQNEKGEQVISTLVHPTKSLLPDALQKLQNQNKLLNA